MPAVALEASASQHMAAVRTAVHLHRGLAIAGPIL
jgi:hypothetical protein